jgi:Leishmanolysin
MEEQTMATFETYQAKADPEIALSIAGTASPFTIEVRFLGGLTQQQMDAFKGAADRWSSIIVGDLPSVLVDGEVIDDVLILAQGAEIDGPGRILGQAGPTHVRPATAGDAAFIPAKGRMTFDTADLEQMEQEGTLNDVIVHEMGHVIGSGTIWDDKGFLKGRGTENPTFEGPSAMEEYGKMRGDGTGPPTPVPVENEGGPGTRDSHWRESVFRNELLTGRIGEAGNPISHVSVGSLQDLGYVVDMNAAEPYELPNLLSLAEEGLLVSHEAPIDVGIMLPNIPEVLPEDSLQ